MSILRNKLKENFTLTPNEILTDNRLSMGAKVVYIYLASKPDGWQVWNGEIQKSLNIKDSGTIAKYWKELIGCGWITRTANKDDSGQFCGGYSYELMITPNTDNDQIGVKPESGKTPSHNNTDLSNNTNIDNNTNNISPDGQNSKTNNVIDKPNNQLFKTDSKPKKKGENKYITVIEEISSNQDVRDALLKYCNFRRQRGLTIDQWTLIVTEFKKQSSGKTTKQVIDCINQCIINGRNSLYYTDYQNTNNFTKPNKSNGDDFDFPY